MSTPPFRRNLVIESQKLLWGFLDSSMINTLVHLFDDKDNREWFIISDTITKPE